MSSPGWRSRRLLTYCCRVPAVWFWPGTFLLTVRDGDATNGDAGCDPPEELQSGSTYTIRIEMRNTLLAVFVNEQLVCSTERTDRSSFEDAVVYAADP